jgi:hypothetical protein
MRLVYVVGAPGAGKSTLCARARVGRRAVVVDDPVRHTLVVDQRDDSLAYAELGVPRATFSGTDVLAMNVQPRAVEWLATRPYDVVLGEGDRLGNASFLDAMRGAGVDVVVAWLDTPPGAAALRRANRAAEVGRAQNEAWVKGRISKVERLVQRENELGRPVHRIDGASRIDEQADQLAGLLGL